MERHSESHRPHPYHRGDVIDEAHRRLREEVPALKEKKMKVAHGFHKVPQTGVICMFHESLTPPIESQTFSSNVFVFSRLRCDDESVGGRI